MDEQIRGVVGLLRETFADDLAGAYLVGSATTGGLRPTSDLDVLGVLRRRSTRAERDRVVAALLELSRKPRHLEVTLVALPDLRPWRFPPPLELQYGDWWRDELARGEEPWAGRDPDLAVLVTMTRQRGRALAGPPAAELLEPVPPHDVVRASLAAVDGLLREVADDTRNVLLTLARAWVTVETGEIRSKADAAEWALERLDVPALARALALYEEGAYGPWDAVDPLADAHRLAAAIRAASTGR